MTNEIVTLLTTYAPDELTRFNASNARSREIKPGQIMGGDDSDVDLALLGLRVADATCDKCVPLLASRLQKSRVLQLASQIVSAVASVSLLSTLSQQHIVWSYVLSALTLLASVAGLISQWLTNSLNPEVPNLATAYAKLIENRFQIAKLTHTLTLSKTSGDQVALKAAIDESNGLCKDVYVLASAVGVSPG